MNRDSFDNLPIDELLVRTQTNITPNPVEGLEIASFAYERAVTPVEKGTAARQAGFRAEQAGQPTLVVEGWFDRSRSALSSDDEAIQRELIATELLTGRAIALRLERIGSKTIELTNLASEAFSHGEKILNDQHDFGKSWDRFGTMLSRHRATYEAMNGSASFAALTAVRGIWRAVRSRKEGTPEEHGVFVLKQIGMNAVAGALATSKLLKGSSNVAEKRHKTALKLLGDKPYEQPSDDL